MTTIMMNDFDAKELLQRHLLPNLFLLLLFPLLLPLLFPLLLILPRRCRQLCVAGGCMLLVGVCC